MLSLSHPEEARRLMGLAQEDVERRWRFLSGLAALPAGQNGKAHQEK
jgi:hypothetical protein